MRISTHINNIKDPATRQAVQAVFDQLKDDLAANKTAFDEHYHSGTTSSDTPKDSGGSAESFTQSLE